MSKHSEQRKYPRAETDVSTIAKALRRTQFQGKVISLSEGGAFLATNENLSQGSEVVLFLTLELPDRRKSCIAQGKVVWSNNDKKKGTLGCGVAFEESNASLRKMARDYVEFKRTGKVTAMGVADEVKSSRAKGRGQLRG